MKDIACLTIVSLVLFSVCLASPIHPSHPQTVFARDPTTSNLETGLGVTKSTSEITKVIRISNIGATSGTFSLYEDEYSRYNIKDTKIGGTEKITGLGLGQCWSSGNYLSFRYPELIDQAIADKNYQINVAADKKYLACARKFLYGLDDTIPFIGLFSDDGVVEQAFSDYGNCFDCPDAVSFPYAKSQTSFSDLGSFFSDATYLKPVKMFQLADECDKVNDFYGGGYEEVPEKDQKILFGLAGIDIRGDHIKSEVLDLVDNYALHLMHNLGELDVTDKFQTMAENLLSGAEKTHQAKYFSLVNNDNWAKVAVYGRSILADIREKMDEDLQVVSYIVDGKNMEALMLLLQGEVSDGGYDQYRANIAANIDILVHADLDTGTRRVNMKVNGELHDIIECGDHCAFDDFLDLIDTAIDRGGDLKDYCGLEQKFSDSWPQDESYEDTHGTDETSEESFSDSSDL